MRWVILGIAFTLAVTAVLVPPAVAVDSSFEIDLSQPTTPFPHFWSRCVGSGHAALALRADWRAALAQSQSALGWEYIRFHGILDDDMSVVIAPGQYSFYDIDSVYDFLQSISMRPIVELSFMPTALASGNQTIFYYKGNITPPADYNQWTDLITSLMKHLVDRYGLDEVSQWYFEVWNEPNCGFWSGSQSDYFTLLSKTYFAIKSVSPRLRVGGPATCQSQWIQETLQYCEANGIKLDFVSTHEYPTDPTNGDRRTLMQDVMTATRTLAQAAGDIPVIYTEFNSGLFGDTPNHDLPYAAAFTVDMVQRTQGLVEMASYWTFSDIFEEGGFQPTPFHDMYGMVTNIGVPKPAYHAFELLHRAGTERVAVHATSGVNSTNTTNVWAVRDDSTLTVFVTNFDYYEFPIQNRSVLVTIPGIASGGSPQAETYLIDSTHTNSRAAWEAMGSPTYPTDLQIAELQAAAQMKPQPLVYGQSGSTISFEVMLAPYSVFAAYIPLQYAESAAKVPAKTAKAFGSVAVTQSARDTTDRLSPKQPIPFGPDFPSPITVTIDPTQTFQQIFGFGGALTEAATSTLSLLENDLRAEVLNAYYSDKGHRYTVGRVPMGSCDFSIESYCFDWVDGDFTMQYFDMNVTHDQATMIPFITAAQQTVATTQPGQTLRLFTTPWTPTNWMKSNGNLNGSNVPGLILDDQHQSAWALYFSRYLTAYANQGITFWGLTIQNEPEYAPVYEGCVYSPEQERDFLKGYLGPTLARDHPNVKIMIYDHNKDDIVKWADTIYSDPDAAQYVWGTAFHWYSGDQFDHLSTVHQKYPDKFLFASEACTCPPSTDWANGESYGHDILGDLQNWSVGWTDWNIVLNPQGGPNHVSNFCNAPIIADTTPGNQTLTYQPAYWYMGHFSRFLPPGSTRIGNTVTGSTDVQTTAWITRDGTTVVVVMNQTDEPITFKLSTPAHGAASVTLLAHSIVSLSY